MRPRPVRHILRCVKLGDKVEFVAKPFARVLGVSCHDADGKLIPGSPCGKKKAWMNGE